ncbi:unnamed protein product [Symbiodinium sp. CCMP2456]|nr:unnamed protein product [Symbiodinium sp. CCMP2456]
MATAWRAGDILTASRVGYAGVAGVTSQHASSGSPVRAEIALNQDKSRLQLRRHASPGKERSFKFSDCAVSENSPTNAYSPRSAAIVPGFSRGSSPLRGLRAGELMSAVRETERSEQSLRSDDQRAAMAWPFQRGRDELIHGRASPFTARSASPFRSRRESRFSGNSGNHVEHGDKQSLVIAATAAAAAEEEAEVDVLRLGGVGRDGHTRPLSPRVRDSHWLDGLSPRIAERGGSRLFPTHLAMPKDRPSPSTGSAKPGGAYTSPRARRSPRATTHTEKVACKKTESKAKDAKASQSAWAKKKTEIGHKRSEHRAGPSVESPQLPAWAKPLEAKSKENGSQTSSKESISKRQDMQALRQRLETRLKAAEQGLHSRSQEVSNTEEASASA